MPVGQRSVLFNNELFIFLPQGIISRKKMAASSIL